MWYRLMKLEATVRSPFVIAYLLIKRVPFSVRCEKCRRIMIDQDSLLSGFCEKCRREMVLDQGKEYYRLMARHSGKVKVRRLVYPSRTSFDHLYKRVLSKISAGKVLDAGCGQGFILSGLDTKACEAYGFDMNADDLNIAKTSVKNGEFCLASIDNVPFLDNTFDYIICTEVLEHITAELSNVALRELYRVLKPGGTAIFTVPNGKGPSGRYSTQHIRFFTFSSISNTIETAGFEIKSAQKFGLYIPFLGLFLESLLRTSGRLLPINIGFNLTVPEALAANFLVECRKPGVKTTGSSIK